jgi:sterol desaturase/sphingolipid hydroxylase (fatty acid hydroxylase superfamily)
MASASVPSRAAEPEELDRVTSAADRFVRAEHLPAGYSPWRHMGCTLAIAAFISLPALLLARGARPLDWAFLPVFLAVANLIEWSVHRYPMHRPMRPRILYKNHAQIHHIAFTDQRMTIKGAPELGLIMMPWYTMVGLFAVASPVMLAAAALRGSGLAGIFLLTAVAYFLGYEALHASYHLPDATLGRAGLTRLRLFRDLQAHHRHHHILRRMSHVNFNVTFPLMDHLFGTAERAEDGGEGGGRAGGPA